MPYAYLVECSDGTFYAGSTWNLELRLHQHNSPRDGAAYTRRRQPVRLVWSAWFDSIAEAYAWEKRIQGWGRGKRIALIEGRYADLPGLASRSHAAKATRPEPPVGRGGAPGGSVGRGGAPAPSRDPGG